MNCTICGDTFANWVCRTCAKKPATQSLCKECHDEVMHGEIGPPMQSRPSVGGMADESPWQQNNIGIMEDGE